MAGTARGWAGLSSPASVFKVCSLPGDNLCGHQGWELSLLPDATVSPQGGVPRVQVECWLSFPHSLMVEVPKNLQVYFRTATLRFNEDSTPRASLISVGRGAVTKRTGASADSMSAWRGGAGGETCLIRHVAHGSVPEPCQPLTLGPSICQAAGWHHHAPKKGDTHQAPLRPPLPGAHLAFAFLGTMETVESN